MCCPIQVPIHEALRSTAELQAFVQQHGKTGRVRPVGALHSSNNQICVEHALDRAVRVTRPKLDPNYVEVRVSVNTDADGKQRAVADIDASLTTATANGCYSSRWSSTQARTGVSTVTTSNLTLTRSSA